MLFEAKALEVALKMFSRFSVVAVVKLVEFSVTRDVLMVVEFIEIPGEWPGVAVTIFMQHHLLMLIKVNKQD